MPLSKHSRIKGAAQEAFDLIHAIERDSDGNPLTLEGTVRSVILKSPDHFQWRDDALNLLYCCLGSGVDWDEHGRLADCSPNNYINPPPQPGGQGVWSRDFGMDDSLAKMDVSERITKTFRNRRKAELRRAAQVVKDIDRRCLTYRPKRSYWYPLSWYAANLCAPVHAQQDFFDGALETAILISAFEVPIDSRHWFEETKTQKCAKEILEALLTMKKTREGGRTK